MKTQRVPSLAVSQARMASGLLPSFKLLELPVSKAARGEGIGARGRALAGTEAPPQSVDSLRARARRYHDRCVDIGTLAGGRFTPGKEFA